MLNLELYKPRDNKYLIRNVIILGIVLAGTYFLFPDTNKTTITLFILAFIFFSAYTEKKNQSIGKIIFENFSINLQVGNKNTVLQLSELKKLDFTYSGYKGKKVAGDFIPKYNRFSGIDNILNIETNTEKYKYNVLFESKTQEDEFIELVETWAKNGYNISDIRINK